MPSLNKHAEAENNENQTNITFTFYIMKIKRTLYLHFTRLQHSALYVNANTSSSVIRSSSPTIFAFRLKARAQCLIHMIMKNLWNSAKEVECSVLQRQEIKMY